MRKLLARYRELIAYGFWGVMTTLVNYAVYFLCTRLLGAGLLTGNILAWIVSVAFAFVVNKLLVFASRRRDTVLRELWQFVSARLLSGVLETLLLTVFVRMLHYPDGPVKVVAGVLVILINYVLSKWIIFRKPPGGA